MQRARARMFHLSPSSLGTPLSLLVCVWGLCFCCLFSCQQYLGLLLINARTLHIQENL